MLEHAEHRVGGGLAQAADRRIAHHGGELLEQRLVPARPLHQLDGLLGAGAARRALAAALVLEEPHQVEGHRLHVVLVGQDDMKADRKSTRLNSSHANISYAVFCLQQNSTSPTSDWD